MSTPSLLLVPARIKAGGTFLGTPGILYSQIPTNGNGDFRLQRDGLFQTRYNDQGLIERVGTNNSVNVIPRLDYYTSSGTPGCPALLVEPAATNTFIESETLFTTHLVQNLTTSGYTNATSSPDGSVTAEKFVPNTTNGVHGIANGSSLAITSGTTYTFSLFVKSDGGPYNLIALSFDSTLAWGAAKNCIFDASNGTNFSVPAGATMTSENYGNGWYRLRATLTAVGSVAAALYQYRIYIANALGNLSWAAPSGNTNGVFCWGAQLETGSVATSYIPTTTAQRTRNADVISVSGAVSGSIGQTEGTIYAEVDFSRVNSGPMITISDGTDGNRIQILLLSSTELVAIIRIAGANANYSVTIPAVPATGGIYKMALGYKANDYCFAWNGITYASTASRGVPACNTLGLGTSATQSTFLNDRIRAAALYTTRLTNADLTLLTMPGNDTYLPQAVWNNYLSRPGNTEVPDCLYTRHADLLDV